MTDETITELHKDVSEILQRTARIEAKIERFEALEMRVTSLEADLNQQRGSSKVYTAIAGFIGAIAGAIISYLIGKVV